MIGMKRKITAIPALILCGAILASCSTDSGEGIPEQEGTASNGTEISEPVTVVSGDPNEVDPNVPVDLSAGVSEKMYSRAIMSEGNVARLAAAMKKAANGEKVTVGVIGGSITQGSSASNQANCYASKFNDWWVNKFPSAEINFVNAGIGGTNSYLGVHRVDEQLLSYQPDVVIV